MCEGATLQGEVDRSGSLTALPRPNCAKADSPSSWAQLFCHKKWMREARTVPQLMSALTGTRNDDDVAESADCKLKLCPAQTCVSELLPSKTL